jgi:VWFA-related protein
MRMRTFYGALLLLPLMAAAQQKPSIPGIGETIEVSIVNLDVFVTNKAGERVRGLTRDDFEILENGVKQPISNFAEYVGETQPETAAGTAKQAAQPQKRTIIVFIERFYMPKFRTEPLFASIKKLLHESIRPGDRVTVVTWNRGVLLTHQEFTDSLPALDRSLDRIATLSAKPFLDPTAETRWSIADIEAFDAQAAANAGGQIPGGDSLADLELQMAAQKEVADLNRKVRSINALMRSIAAADGKKILLLATHRLSLEAGAEHYYAAGRMSIPGEKRQALDMRTLLKSIEETANANGVTIYPVFPEGLTTVQSGGAGSSTPDYLILNNETPALKRIADATGGLTAWGSDDVVKLLPRVREDLDSYYSLAYRVQSSGTDKARNIVVRTKDKSLTVRSRREFMEKSDVTRMEDRVIAALFRNPPSPGFPLRVEIGQRRARGKQFVVPINVYIPIAALTALPSGNQYAGAFSVYFAWGGKLGGISDTTHATKSYKIPAADIEKARGTHFTYEFELTADQRTERVALGVLDEVSKEYALRLIQLKR